MARGSVNSRAGLSGSGFGPRTSLRAGLAFHAEPAQEVAPAPPGRVGPGLFPAPSKTMQTDPSAQKKCAWLNFFFACARDLREATHRLSKINQRQDWGAGKTNSECGSQ